MPRTLIEIDRSSAEPLYRQVRRAIEHGIASGVFDIHHRLPSSRELAIDLAVSRNTINLAYQELVAEGYVRSHERSGMFVNPEMLDAAASETRATVPRIDWTSPDPATARRRHTGDREDQRLVPVPLSVPGRPGRQPQLPRARLGPLPAGRALSAARQREPSGQCGRRRPDADRHDPPAAAAAARDRGGTRRGPHHRRLAAGPRSGFPAIARPRPPGRR